MGIDAEITHENLEAFLDTPRGEVLDDATGGWCDFASEGYATWQDAAVEHANRDAVNLKHCYGRAPIGFRR